MRPATLVAAVLVALMLAACGGSSSSVEISYRSFIEQVQSGNVRSVSAAGRAISGTFKHAVTYPPTAQTKSVRFWVEIPTYAPKAPVVRLLKTERVRMSGLGGSS
jgi:ATP-dependent Zn protease